MPRHRITKSPRRIKKAFSLQWVFEPLELLPDFFQRRMFGCHAAYLEHRLVLVLADKEEPWNGILIPTEREFHSSLRDEFPILTPHPVLGKWLYLSQNAEEFEDVSNHVISKILRKDPRIGVDPKQKTKKTSRIQRT